MACLLLDNKFLPVWRALVVGCAGLLCPASSNLRCIHDMTKRIPVRPADSDFIS